jgi:hypothetical protein
MNAKHFLDNFKNIREKLQPHIEYQLQPNDIVGGQCVAALVCEEYWGVPQTYDIPVVASNIPPVEESIVTTTHIRVDPTELIHNLDLAALNCLGITAFLEEDELIYSNDFLYFLESQQLEITYPINAGRAALQFLTYSQYFNVKDKSENVRRVYVDIEKYTYEFIYPSLCHYFTLSRLSFRDFKYYLQCQELCDKYFTIFENSGSYLKPKNGQYYVGYPFGSASDFIRVYRSLNKPGLKKSTKETLQELLPYKNLRQTLTKEYVTNLPKDWKDQLKGLDKFLTDHDRLWKYFKDKTLAEQLKLYRLLCKVCKGQNIWILGEIENSNLVELTEESISGLVRNKRLELNRALVAPVTLPEFKYGWVCKELTSPLLLKEEGAYNRHCVGGYSSSLKDTHRIFSFRKEGIRFTVETYTTTSKKWAVSQAKGFGNCTINSYPTSTRGELQQNLDLLIDTLSKTRVKKEDFEL